MRHVLVPHSYIRTQPRQGMEYVRDIWSSRFALRMHGEVFPENVSPRFSNTSADNEVIETIWTQKEWVDRDSNCRFRVWSIYRYAHCRCFEGPVILIILEIASYLRSLASFSWIVWERFLSRLTSDRCFGPGGNLKFPHVRFLFSHRRHSIIKCIPVFMVAYPWQGFWPSRQIYRLDQLWRLL